MAQHFREPERRQQALLPADMMEWLSQDDIVHLIVEAVAMMDLSKFEAGYRLGGAGQAAFAPQMLLALLIYAYSQGVRSSQAVERLCRRDAGYRFIVGDEIPDHTVIARFRRRDAVEMKMVFLGVLRLCREAGLVKLGLSRLPEVLRHARPEPLVPGWTHPDRALRRSVGRTVDTFCERLRKRTTPDFIAAFGRRLPRSQKASLLPSSPSMRVWSAARSIAGLSAILPNERHVRWLMANDPVAHA